MFVSVTSKISTNSNEKDKKENNVRFVFEISFFQMYKSLDQKLSNEINFTKSGRESF